MGSAGSTGFCGESGAHEERVGKPFVCRIGLHDWQGVPARVRNQYAVEMECSRCGARKIMR